MASLELIVNGLGMLERNGFHTHKYGNDVRDVDYRLETDDYLITVDPWFDVFLERKDCDFIRLKVEIDSEHELQELIAFCEGGYE